MSNIAILYSFAQAQQLLNDPQLSSPQVSIEPVDTLVQKAVDLIKSKEPNFFIGIRKIVIDMGQGYGRVESGPGKDPAVIHINLSAIKNTLKSQLGNAPQPEFDSKLIRQVAEVIAHERGHAKSFDPQKGFVGNEAPAEAAEREMHQKLQNALP